MARRTNLDPPLRLHNRQIFILPNRFGLAFSLLLFAMLMGGLNYNNNAALFLAFMLSGSGLVSMFRGWRNLAGLEIDAVTARAVHVGENACFRFLVGENEGLERPALAVENAAPHYLPANGNLALSLQVPTHRRGLQRCPRFRLVTHYPLSLFRTWSWLRPRVECLVYPRAHPQPPPLPLPAHGEARFAVQPDPDADFAGLRDYRPGDNLREIAWKASARAGKLISREQPPRAQSKLLLTLSDTGQGNPETALEILTAWILQAHKAGMRYGISLPGVETGVDRGRRHRDHCLRELALWQG